MLLDNERGCHYKRFSACPTNQLLQTLGQKWAPAILHHLADGRWRYGDLRRAIPSATQKMMTQTLRQLERKGLIAHHLSGSKPPLVSEYELSPAGKSLAPILREMTEWADAHFEANDG
jgi:DNA-binding HxlR family transcriptional regulator